MISQHSESETRKQVRNALRECDGWVPVKTVAAHVEKNPGTVRKHLLKLAENHAAIEQQTPLVKQHGYKFRYVRLPEWVGNQ